MPRVLCTLPNASEEISGVKFTATEDGMLSEEISDELAADFVSIRGYAMHGAKPAKAAEPKTAAPAPATRSGGKKPAAAAPAPAAAPAADAGAAEADAGAAEGQLAADAGAADETF